MSKFADRIRGVLSDDSDAAPPDQEQARVERAQIEAREQARQEALQERRQQRIEQARNQSQQQARTEVLDEDGDGGGLLDTVKDTVAGLDLDGDGQALGSEVQQSDQADEELAASFQRIQGDVAENEEDINRLDGLIGGGRGNSQSDRQTGGVGDGNSLFGDGGGSGSGSDGNDDDLLNGLI